MKSPSRSALLAENVVLHLRLEEAEQTLRAIRSGEVDALMIESADGPQVYILQGQDAEANRTQAAMLAQVSDAVITVDDETRIIYLNAAAERLYDFTASRCLGQILSTIYVSRWLHPEDEEAAKTALRERGEWRGENVHVRHDGRELDVESGITVLRDLAGQPTGLLAVIRDITERKQHEDKVRVSEIRYRRLFEAAHDGVLILDPHTGKIVEANPFMTQLLGYPHDELVKMLMAEVNHRAKNLLAVVQAVAQQTAKHGDAATFIPRLSERIGGLAAGQDLLVNNQWQGVEVSDLIGAQLAHFGDLIGTRVLLTGPAAQLTADAAQGIGMALHELATNAAKYGALSNSEGRICIDWQISTGTKPKFSMSWLERGGPKVSAPSRSGFGQIVIGRMAEAAVQGVAKLDYEETGLSWNLSTALENVLALPG
jgi:PAS domain S-box-containing protein